LHQALPLVISSVFLAISTALGFALDKFNVEAQLAPLLPKAIADPSALLILIATAFFFVNQVLGARVGGARQKFNVKHPLMYPSEKDVAKLEDRLAFMAVVRGHENWLESNAQTIFAVLANWSITKNYATIFVLSTAIAVARILYAQAYSVSPAARVGPFVVATLANASLQGALLWFLVKRFI
jgi:hypothetical protein